MENKVRRQIEKADRCEQAIYDAKEEMHLVIDLLGKMHLDAEKDCKASDETPLKYDPTDICLTLAETIVHCAKILAWLDQAKRNTGEWLDWNRKNKSQI